MYFITYDNETHYDRFGAQIQRILSLYLLTKFFKLNYFHSNIIINRNRNVDFYSLKDVTDEVYLEKFNNLFAELTLSSDNNIEFKNEIRILSFDINEIQSIMSTPIDYNVLIKVRFCHSFIDNNPNILEQFISPSLHWIDSHMNDHLNIACHIRRGDVSLTENVDRYVSVDVYINIINHLTNILSGYSFEYNIYCDSITPDEMNKIIMNCSTSKITFHINTDLIHTFMTFVNSDILIAGNSSLSYSASFLRQKGIILYIPIQHVYSTKHIKLETDNSIIINKEKILNSLSGRTPLRDRIEGPEINKSEERVTPIIIRYILYGKRYGKR